MGSAVCGFQPALGQAGKAVGEVGGGADNPSSLLSEASWEFGCAPVQQRSSEQIKETSPFGSEDARS